MKGYLLSCNLQIGILEVECTPLGAALDLQESNAILGTNLSWPGEFPCIFSITTPCLCGLPKFIKMFLDV